MSTRKLISVLIVDDDAIVRRINKALLTKFKAETTFVVNGKEAVDLFRSGAHFDLVIMDMEMPVMDGPQATRELRGMGIGTMIVGVTSRGLEMEKEPFIRAGVDQCYEKPLNSIKLTCILEELAKKLSNKPE